MTVFEWFETFATDNNVYVTVHRLQNEHRITREPWSIEMVWGSEAPDSPMAGAAAYGMGATLEEALVEACKDCGYRP